MFSLKKISLLLLLCTLLPNIVLAEPIRPTQEEQAFLEKIQKDALQYFIRHTHPDSGLVLDSTQPGSPASTAATGFGIVALIIGYEKGWVTYKQAYTNIENVLKTLLDHASNENGVYYHFLDQRTGRRVWASEASSIDTALLVAGALTAGEYFKDSDIEKMAWELYRKVDWNWMLDTRTLLVSMGWKPKSGFLPYYWDTYSEHLILQALAIGSPTHPIPAEAWEEWARYEEEINGNNVVYSHSGSLFTYQYPHAFIDFRHLSDAGINYFENSVNATLANRNFCILHSDTYSGYGENSWGLSASLGPGGYHAFGAEPGMAEHDGTVAIHAIAGSLPFTPRESMDALKYLYETHGENIYGKYGFVDSFNLDKNWWSNHYIGIDQGLIVMMIENYLNERVWKLFMNLEPIKQWIEKCQLSEAV